MGELLAPRDRVPRDVSNLQDVEGIIPGSKFAEVARYEWYKSLITQCKELLIEARFTSNWVLIQAYHSIGSALNEHEKEFGRSGIYGRSISERVARSLNTNSTYIYDARNFAKMFPDLSRFPGDKTSSWSKVRINYLMSPEAKEKALKNKHKHCPKCGYQF